MQRKCDRLCSGDLIGVGRESRFGPRSRPSQMMVYTWRHYRCHLDALAGTAVSAHHWATVVGRLPAASVCVPSNEA